MVNIKIITKQCMQKNSMMRNTIYIFGFGAFGSAIAYALSCNPSNDIYVSDPNILSEENIKEVINSSGNLSVDYSRLKLFSGKNFIKNSFIFLAIPSKSIEEWIVENKKLISPDIIIVNLSKGFNINGGLIFDSLTEYFPENILLTVKGPSFAEEIKRGYPTLLTISYNRHDHKILSSIKEVFDHSSVVLEYNPDFIGVEVLSVLKNIYSIFMGIVDARYDAANTTFFALTKSINEIQELLIIYGGKKETLFSSAGIGDFGLTGLNDMSRNRTFGLFVGKGFYDKRNRHSVLVEGVRSIELVYLKAYSHNVADRFPILSFLYGLFFDNKDINELSKLLYVL